MEPLEVGLILNQVALAGIAMNYRQFEGQYTLRFMNPFYLFSSTPDRVTEGEGLR